MPERVFVTRKLPGNALDRLGEEYEVDIWENEIPPTKRDIATRAKNCVGIITLLSDTIDRELIDSLHKIKIIAQYAVGFDNIDIATATKKGIMVTNTPGVLTETTADLTWALIMTSARRIVEADNYVKGGKWKVAWGPEMLLGVDVYGKTIGIIGMGRIGFSVARRASGFGMKILFHSRSETDLTKKAVTSLCAESVSLEKLLRLSDIVSIHVPLTDETRGMISESEFSLMKKEAIIVNTSRGAVVDEAALFEALRTGKIRSAGLDVFQDEPTPRTNPLLQLENVVALPHIGSASIATRSKMAEMCVDNLIIALKGNRPPDILNPEVL